jgi:RHS repeat-associated protein
VAVREVRVGFCGYLHDPDTGWSLARHRWYDADAGRWITRDPAGYIDGLSLYLYVKGNPLSLVDPMGLAGLGDWLVNAGAACWNAAESWLPSNVPGGSAALYGAAVLATAAGDGLNTAQNIAVGSMMTGTSPAAYVATNMVVSAIESEQRYSERTGNEFSKIGVAHQLLSNATGINAIATAVHGFDPGTCEQVTGLDRVAAGFTGGGGLILTCTGFAELSGLKFSKMFNPGENAAAKSPVLAEAVAEVGALKRLKGGDKAFSTEKAALVEMAKRDKRTGITQADMDAYKQLDKELPDPFETGDVRGAESHPKAASPSSRQPHGHVGPVNHIPIKEKDSKQ